jgi:uncharacterized protein (DUF488 family)
MNPGTKLRIYTVGHGNAPFHEIERILHKNGVVTIVDVRSVPYSKHAPDFRKSALSELTAAAGLGYRWMGDRLGGRHPGSSRDSQSDDPAASESDAVETAIGEVLALNESGPVALLCSERAPEHCHRHLLLAPRLEAAGVEVYHILGEGAAHRYQPTLGI